jgi:hypothetical protein
MEPALIKPGAEGDLPGIADVLNFTIMNSNAAPLVTGAGPYGGPYLAH